MVEDVRETTAQAEEHVASFEAEYPSFTMERWKFQALAAAVVAVLLLLIGVLYLGGSHERVNSDADTPPIPVVQRPDVPTETKSLPVVIAQPGVDVPSPTPTTEPPPPVPQPSYQPDSHAGPNTF